MDWLLGDVASLLRRQQPPNILLLGLDYGGKSTLFRNLKDKRSNEDRPRAYPISEELSVGNFKFKAFDLGGHKIACRVWKDYCAKVDAVVYVVDAYEKERFAESKKEVDALLSDGSLATVPFLILCNKYDVPCGASEDKLSYHQFDTPNDFTCTNQELEDRFCDYMGLTGRTTGKGKGDSGVRPLEVFLCCIVRNMGYASGFKWVSQYTK